MSFGFGTQGLVPGIGDTRFSLEAEVMFGPIEHNRAFVIPGLLWGSIVFTPVPADPTYNTALIPAGTLLSLSTTTTDDAGLGASSGKLKLYDPQSVTDNDGVLYGLTIQAINLADVGGVRSDKWIPILQGGNVKSAQLVNGNDAVSTAPGGWMTGAAADEATIRAAMQDKRFILDDHTGTP